MPVVLNYHFFPSPWTPVSLDSFANADTGLDYHSTSFAFDTRLVLLLYNFKL